MVRTAPDGSPLPFVVQGRAEGQGVARPMHRCSTPSIAVGPNRLPVIAYWNPERHVVLAVCEDDGCSRSTLVDFGDVGSHTLGFGPDGLPFLLYHESGDLKLAMCQNPACLQK